MIRWGKAFGIAHKELLLRYSEAMISKGFWYGDNIGA